MILPKEQTITVEGVEYKLSKFDITLLQEFLEWTKAVLPDPFEGLAKRIEGLPEHLQLKAYEKAESKAELRGTSADPDVDRLIKSGPGAKKMLHLLFRKHQPHLTEDQVADIVERGIRQHGEEYFSDLFSSGEGKRSGKPD